MSSKSNRCLYQRQPKAVWWGRGCPQRQRLKWWGLAVRRCQQGPSGWPPGVGSWLGFGGLGSRAVGECGSVVRGPVSGDLLRGCRTQIQRQIAYSKALPSWIWVEGVFSLPVTSLLSLCKSFTFVQAFHQESGNSDSPAYLQAFSIIRTENVLMFRILKKYYTDMSYFI